MKASGSPVHRDGRDEMNLAEFPLSALQRAQKSDGQGGKLDRLEFTASRYDPTRRQRVQQKVTLTSTARDGLPTPADEHVILALLYTARHQGNFEDATVHFAPVQLFEIMGWAPNGRSYTRLRDVLRRLKALTIRYENAWWDMAGRSYEEEVATGIVSGYCIARQVSGPRRDDTPLQSWVTWTQQFHASLKAGNLKRLNLEVFFQLSSPTAQRMYRFLDKRFYNSPELSLDLIEFACGHIGLTDAGNVALLKRRLTPALAELEKIGFLEPESPEKRFHKVKVGQWRIVLKAASASKAAPAASSEPAALVSVNTATAVAEVVPTANAELAQEFYRLWNPQQAAQPGPRDLEQAGLLLQGRSREEAFDLLKQLVQVTRKEWPECRSLSGAVQKYLTEAVRLQAVQQRREMSRREAEVRRLEQRQISEQRQDAGQQLQTLWDALSGEQRQAIETQVRQRLSGNAPAAFVHRLCLQELGQRLGGGSAQ